MIFLRTVEQIIVRYRFKIVWMHAIMCVFFLVLLFFPLYERIPTSSDTIYTNWRLCSKMLVWQIWFPLVLFSTIIWGRSWCGLLCPLGAFSEWSSKYGLKRPVPFWLSWPGTPILSFIIVTIIAQTLDVRSYVESMSLLFTAMIIIAVSIGYLYGNNKRVWCRYMCPIGWLLGVYSRLGIFELKSKRSVVPHDVITEKTMCPMLINIKTKKQSLHCINCMRCVSVKAKGGLVPYLRAPGHEIAHISEYTPLISENVFFFLASGLSMGGTRWLVGSQFIQYKEFLASFFYTKHIMWVFHTGSRFLVAVYPGREQLMWIDFISIVSYMLIYTVAIFIILFISNSIFTWISCGLGDFWNQFVTHSYQYAPNVMISILLALGGGLFIFFHAGFLIKSSLFSASVIWSLFLGYRILRNKNIVQWRCVLACVPNIFTYSVLFILWLPVLQ